MTVLIKKNDVGIRFYIGKYENQDVATIYAGSKVAYVNDNAIESARDANLLSQLLSLVGVFIQSLEASDKDMKKKVFDVTYVNAVTFEEKDVRYTARNVLRRLYSGKIVSVDMKNRIRFQFVSFGFKDGRIIINYKPVIW